VGVRRGESVHGESDMIENMPSELEGLEGLN